jgi:hypothetical protein
VGIRTLIRYLVGDEDAILELAGNRWSLLVGLLFVLSAGFAREYDGQDLLHEPWHLLIPLAVSVVASLGLFAIVRQAIPAGYRPAFRPAYISFLGLFWLTAPLAWLYAIPYERFLSESDATRANLATLGLVALWRVALMVRVLVVLWNWWWWAAFCLVLVFADLAAVVAIYLAPFPVIELMGGIRAENEEFLNNVAIVILSYGICCFPFWLVGAIAVVKRNPPGGPEPLPPPTGTPRLPLWGLAVGSLAIWLFILPFTQPEQQLRYRVEQALIQGRIEDGLAEMSAHQSGDFPPHWNPPPREPPRGYKAIRPRLVDVLRVLADRPVADWVRATYRQKCKELLTWGYVDPKGIEELDQVLQRYPEGEAGLAEVAGLKWPPPAFERLKEYREAKRIRPPPQAVP